MTRTPDSLRNVLLRRLWLPLLLLLLASAVGSFALARHYAEQVYDRWLWDSAMSLTQLLHSEDGQVRIDMPQATARMFTWDTVDHVYGQVISGDTTLFGDPAIPAAAAGSGDGTHYYETRIDGHTVRAVQIHTRIATSAEPVTIRAAETLIKRHRLERRLLLSSIPLQATVLTLAGLMIWWGVGAAIRTTNQAAQQLATFDIGNLQPLPTPGDSPRELQPALYAINTLIARLAAAQQQQQRFVANAAHQLRTPLAAMQVQLESALREQDPSAQRSALNAVREGLGRLHHLTHQILMLNRSEAGDSGVLELRRLDLAELCREVLEQHADQAIAQQADLGYEGPDQGVFVRGEAQLLRELVGNLVDNALRYGRKQGQVTLTLQASPPTILVDDNGPGIAEAERGRVVERFYRNTQQGDGCGLGLAIVAEIAERHGAQFHISQSPSGGARIRVVFPASG
ncbi:sensor histidine kinase [Stenotrophomonas sp. YIM B06876]|uniref:sensor histidine kinase n=1 Tax=Stenotrophomonas sp. YIM B06876 TaxID=3060211 RepID=UPI0027392484|nr:sensor histidine kinase [Stenotrophomonas sp. YIM B06876]